MRQSPWRFPVSLGKSVHGLWPDLGLLVPFLPRLRVPFLWSESHSASDLPSKGCWCQKQSKVGSLIPYSIHSKVRQQHCSPRISLFMTTYVPDTRISKTRTVPNKSYLLTSNWQRTPAQWVSVCTGKLLFMTSTTSLRSWLSLTLDSLSSFCFLWQKEQISEILTVFKQLPEVTKVLPIHITAAELYYVALKECGKWSEIWELSRDKDVFQPTSEGTCKKAEMLWSVYNHMTTSSQWFVTLSSAKKLNTHFCCVF